MNWVSIPSGYDLSPLRRQAVTLTNADFLSIGPLGINFSEIRIKIQDFSSIQSKYKSFHLWKWISKRRFRNGEHYVKGEMSEQPESVPCQHGLGATHRSTGKMMWWRHQPYVNSHHKALSRRITRNVPGQWQRTLALMMGSHDDVIKWKHFPRNWPFVRGIHRSRRIPHTKASDAGVWCFPWSASE